MYKSKNDRNCKQTKLPLIYYWQEVSNIPIMGLFNLRGTICQTGKLGTEWKFAMLRRKKYENWKSFIIVTLPCRLSRDKGFCLHKNFQFLKSRITPFLLQYNNGIHGVCICVIEFRSLRKRVSVITTSEFCILKMNNTRKYILNNNKYLICIRSVLPQRSGSRPRNNVSLVRKFIKYTSFM